MKKLIPSEAQAEELGERLTSGARGREFEVFWYEHRPTRLTLFYVQVSKTKQTITTH